jgi:hypothetical protein
MNISEMRFPRQMEAEGSAESIRRLLMERTVKLWPEGKIDIPVIVPCAALQKALQRARLQGRIRLGYEEISQKLAAEKKGIGLVRQQTIAPYGGRVSRLLFFSGDGAERFYRNIEQILLEHEPRLLGCRLEIDGDALGTLITGRSGIIKIIMIEHKDAVTAVLKSLITEDGKNGKQGN